MRYQTCATSASVIPRRYRRPHSPSSKHEARPRLASSSIARDRASRARRSARHAVATAPPAITMQREPQVPVEYGVSAVSPWMSAHVLRIDAQHFVRDLGERGLQSLAVRVRADPQLQHAVGRQARARTARARAPSGCPSRNTRWCRARPARRTPQSRRRSRRPSGSPRCWRARTAAMSIAATARRTLRDSRRRRNACR